VTTSWNEFLDAYTFLRSSEMFPAPVALAQLIIGGVQPWGGLMATSRLTVIPVISIDLRGRKHTLSGLTAGSVTMGRHAWRL
jgi:N,N'-diacetylchitobiose transport system permease protein